MREKFRTVRATIQGATRAMLFVANVVAASQWFEFEPLPDDVYEIHLKQENEDLMLRILSAVYAVHPTIEKAAYREEEGEEEEGGRVDGGR